MTSGEGREAKGKGQPVFPTLPLQTGTLTLEEAVARLAGHPTVEGVVTMGSTGTDRLKPESDFDLFVILSELPVPLWQVFTQIDRRLSEVYFAPVAAIERLVAEGAVVPADTIRATQLEWLQSGQIAFDRAGRLAHAQARAREMQVAPVRERDVYAAWYKINYNVLSTMSLRLIAVVIS